MLGYWPVYSASDDVPDRRPLAQLCWLGNLDDHRYALSHDLPLRLRDLIPLLSIGPTGQTQRRERYLLVPTTSTPVSIDFVVVDVFLQSPTEYAELMNGLDQKAVR